MDKPNLIKNINIFCAYRFISRFYMYLPILPIILFHYGLSYIEISYVLAAHGLSIMLFKEPVGILGKKITSNKIVIFMGEIFKSIGVVGLAFSQDNIWLLLIAQVISGLGFALTSSTESNLLLKAMKAENVQNDYREIEAKSQGLGFISMLIAGVIGSIIAKTNMAMAVYLTAPFSLLAAASILLFHEPAALLSDAIPGEGVSKSNAEVEIKGVIHFLMYYALNRAVIMSVFLFAFPLALRASNIDITYFGLIIGLFSVTAYLIGNNFKKVESVFKGSQLWVITPVALLIAIILLTLENKALLMIVPILLGIAASIVRPLTMGKLNSVIKKNNAAVMSRGEQFFGALNAFILLSIGYAITYSNLLNTLYMLLLLISLANIGLIVLFKFMRKFSKQDECPKNVFNG